MKNNINILLVDDHPIIIDAYRSSILRLSQLNSNLKFTVNSALNSDSALQMFNDAESEKSYDIVFLDIRLPSKNPKISSGKELGLIFKKQNPLVKIIVITGYKDMIMFHDILQNLNPHGLLYKSDADIKTIDDAIKNILSDVPYYSASVLRLLRKSISSKIVLCDIDKQLLYALANGFKTKDLKDLLPLSQGGVEKRKRQLKQRFGNQKFSDEELIISARERGFL